MHQGCEVGPLLLIHREVGPPLLIHREARCCSYTVKRPCFQRSKARPPPFEHLGRAWTGHLTMPRISLGTPRSAGQQQTVFTPTGGRAGDDHDRAARLVRMQACVRTVLEGLGEDVDREGLRDTPKRVAKALLDVTVGYGEDAASLIGSALFHEDIVGQANAGIVLVRDIDFASTSEANLLPFHGRAHIAYVPIAGVVLGLSKLARITRCFSKRLTSPQRLAAQIGDAFRAHVPCSGVAVVLEARTLEPGTQLPPQLVAASLAGVFAQRESPELEELEALLGLSDLSLAASGGVSSVALFPGSHSSASMLSCGSGMGSVLAPCTPDASEKASTDGEAGTDGESDVAMDGCCCEGADGGDSSEACEASCGVCDEAPSHVAPMEAAVAELLQELGYGVDDARWSRSARRATARRYVSALLASTSGYGQALPSSSGSSGNADCTQQMDADVAGSRSGSACSTSSAWSVEQQGAGAAPVLCSSVAPSVGMPAPQQPQPQQLLHATIPFASQCEHHMLPFYGRVHVAVSSPHPLVSLPTAEQIEAVVGMFTRRLQVQERITQQVADGVAALLGLREDHACGGDARNPGEAGASASASAGSGGVMVVVDAAHMCMVARGVENHSGSTTSIAARGVFRSSHALRTTVLQSAAAARMEAGRSAAWGGRA
ncbi:hypothetical protein FOA52_001358 [Chlamydomonas sp. UWO 241]|nr:hypothetical protein FOA52_001358 [Chlamydomonas sp. UWO 241]